MGMVMTLLLMIIGAADTAVPLWDRYPFDRVTFTDGTMRDIDPVRIPPGTDFTSVVDNAYVGRPGLPPRSEIRRTVKYSIHDQQEGTDHEIVGRTIRKIDYYEDMLIAQAKRDIDLGRFDESFKLLSAVSKRSPSWAGLNETWVDHYYREGIRQRSASQWEASFDSFLQARLKQSVLEMPVELNPPLEELLNDITDKWIRSFVSHGDYLAARRVIARVEENHREGISAPRIKKDLLAKSHSLLVAAQSAVSEKRWDDARSDLEAAINIDPSDQETRTSLEQLYQSHGHLRVGVEQLANFFGGPADWSAADGALRN